jgi:hypothetical protein
MEAISYELENIILSQKRPRGRPRTQPLNKKDYNKEYRKKVYEEKGETYSNIVESIKSHNKISRKALNIIKEIKDDDELPEKFRIILNSIFK